MKLFWWNEIFELFSDFFFCSLQSNAFIMEKYVGRIPLMLLKFHDNCHLNSIATNGLIDIALNGNQFGSASIKKRLSGLPDWASETELRMQAQPNNIIHGGKTAKFFLLPKCSIVSCRFIYSGGFLLRCKKKRRKNNIVGQNPAHNEKQWIVRMCYKVTQSSSTSLVK